MLCSGCKAIHLTFISESGDYLSIAIELKNFLGMNKNLQRPSDAHSLFIVVSQWVFRLTGIANTGYKKGKGKREVQEFVPHRQEFLSSWQY